MVVVLAMCHSQVRAKNLIFLLFVSFLISAKI